MPSIAFTDFIPVLLDRNIWYFAKSWSRNLGFQDKRCKSEILFGNVLREIIVRESRFRENVRIYTSNLALNWIIICAIMDKY